MCGVRYSVSKRYSGLIWLSQLTPELGTISSVLIDANPSGLDCEASNRLMNGFLISGTILHGKRICLGATLFSSLVFVTAVPGFAQDLGALAREAQARKDAQPFHINHVYTNEDLQRPQILLPEDQHAAASAPKPLLPETPPEMPVLEVNAPEVSLGEIARKYQKAKLAMKPPRVPRPAVTAHVYSNDDLVRDKILTPKDTEFYKAALERPVAPAVVAPQREAQAAETVAASEVSLGDLARAAYQQARQELQAK